MGAVLDGGMLHPGRTGRNHLRWLALTQIGMLPNQSEDGVFVTAQRIQDVNGSGGVPEPLTLSIFGAGVLGIAAMRKRARP